MVDRLFYFSVLVEFVDLWESILSRALSFYLRYLDRAAHRSEHFERMGFNFKGLTSNALLGAVSRTDGTNESEKRRSTVEIPNEKGVVNDINAAYDGARDSSTEGGSFDNSEVDSVEMSKRPDQSAQYGVQMQQAMTLTWSKKDIILAYIM